MHTVLYLGGRAELPAGLDVSKEQAEGVVRVDVLAGIVQTDHERVEELLDARHHQVRAVPGLVRGLVELEGARQVAGLVVEEVQQRAGQGALGWVQCDGGG